MYADDTVILVHGKNWTETRLYAESALRVVMEWLTSNLLTLNLDKTKFITFAPRIASQPASPFNLTAHKCCSIANTSCSCNVIMRTNSIKYLGVIIDSTMSWNEHIGSLVSRVRKLIFVFKKLRSSADFHTLKVVYSALGHSIITYCIGAWGGSGKCLLLRLERAQRAVLKVMAHKPIRFPTIELYAHCKVPTVRHAFLISTILRKHSELTFDPHHSSKKRRADIVCQTEPANVVMVKRQYHFFGPVLYNKINKILNIYPLTSRECKALTDKWLHSLTYEELEDLL